MATDAEIRAAGYEYISPQRYLQNPFVLPTTEEEEVTQGSGIPYTGAFTGAFTGGGGNNYPGSTQNLITDFGTAITDRQAQLNAGEINTLPGMNKPQSYEDIMDKGYQEPGGMVMPGIIGLMNKFGIQNFAGLPQADQAFIASQSGYTGPTVFGDQGGMGHSVDPFGKNIESLSGNYAEGVREDLTSLKESLGTTIADKYGVKWDEETGVFTGARAQEAMDKTKMLRTRWKFRKDQFNEQEGIQKKVLAGQMARAKEYGAAGRSDPQDQSRAGALGRRPGSGSGPTTQDSAASQGESPGSPGAGTGGYSYDPGGREGFGYGLMNGGLVSIL